MNQKNIRFAWITHNRPKEIGRSVKHLRELKTSFKLDLFVSNSGLNELNLDSDITVLEGEKRSIWISQFVCAALKIGIDPSVIHFALDPFKDYANPNQIVTTGANRNVLLLALIGEKFISLDDDVILDIFRGDYKNWGDYIPSDHLNHLAIKCFENKNDLEKFKSQLSRVSLDEFISTHLQMLNTETENGLKRCALSLSGYLGDSGFSSPRFIFGVENSTLPFLANSNRQLENAIKSRFVCRGAEQKTLTSLTSLMPLCSGFSNDLELPPFFPIGRNQDGAYSYAIHACLPSSLIAHLDLCVVHDPTEIRSYSNCLDEIKIRINDLIAFIWIEFIKTNKLRNYENASHFFTEFSNFEDDIFFEKMTLLIEKNLDQRAQRIREKIQKINPNQIEETKEWIFLAEREVHLCQRKDRALDFFIPMEALEVTKERSSATALVKQWIYSYGKLLEAWPRIRILAKEIASANFSNEKSAEIT